MASLKRKARVVSQEKDVCMLDSVLELSVIVGYLGAYVKVSELDMMESLLRVTLKWIV
jgi:hypothetical protein